MHFPFALFCAACVSSPPPLALFLHSLCPPPPSPRPRPRPGTGKTRTLVSFVELLCRAAAATPERRQQLGAILAVADTNAAVDNLAEGLLGRGIRRAVCADRGGV